ncbi:hypothetical protein D3C73_908970 [compost metagenome]
MRGINTLDLTRSERLRRRRGINTLDWVRSKQLSDMRGINTLDQVRSERPRANERYKYPGFDQK